MECDINFNPLDLLSINNSNQHDEIIKNEESLINASTIINTPPSNNISNISSNNNLEKSENLIQDKKLFNYDNKNDNKDNKKKIDVHEYDNIILIDKNLRPGEFVLQTLFIEFGLIVENKIDVVLSQDTTDKLFLKILQKGEDVIFDQLLAAFGSVAEHCLPSLIKILFAWYEKQLSATQQHVSETVKSHDSSLSDKSENINLVEKRDLCVEFIFCLFLIEVLKQLPLHPGHEDLINYIEVIAFKHFKYTERNQTDPNIENYNIIADLYAEVIGVLAQSRFQSVRKIFLNELNELKFKEATPFNTNSIISLLMGMKFFRVKMVPIEEFEASFQFMQECAQYFLEVKDKDIKHALAGLFVEILVPVAASVKNEVNVPCLKNFVETLFSPTLDLCTKKKHLLAIFPLVTCLLCVSQKTFFIQNWHYFLHICLSNLKNRDQKISRVALESLYRLLWVYMIRIKCESNTATQSKLHSIVNSLFPKGTKAIVPRDTPLNIFVKIIQFIAQERLDFAMKEIVFDLLSVGRNFKIIVTPERMSIGLRAFLVVADSLQRQEGEPPMPRTSEKRVKKKSYLNSLLTDEMAQNIGMNHYYPHVKKVLNDILRALDAQLGKPYMKTTLQHMNKKELDDLLGGERKPKIDLFRTCIAAIPRLIPEEMSKNFLIDMLSRLTIHIDEELSGLAFQSLQNIINDFVDWREDVIDRFNYFLLHEVNDTLPQVLDNSLRVLIQLITNWKISLQKTYKNDAKPDLIFLDKEENNTIKVLRETEALSILMLTNYRQLTRKCAVLILKETRTILKYFTNENDKELFVLDVIDEICPTVVENCLPFISTNCEKQALYSVSFNVDLQWLADRTSISWTLDDDFKTSIDQKEPKITAWYFCLMEFMSEIRIKCPTVTYYCWSFTCTRMNTLFPLIENNSINEYTNNNRASGLLRGATVNLKKVTPIEQKDVYLCLWKNYLMLACRIAPSCSTFAWQNYNSSNLSQPDSLLSSSYERTSASSLIIEKLIIEKDKLIEKTLSDKFNNDNNKNKTSANQLFKKVLPYLRSEQNYLRSATVLGLSYVNENVLKEFIDELSPFLREALDRKQENMRRRKRRDLLRLQLVKLFSLISDRNTFSISNFVLDRQIGTLAKIILDYIDGIRFIIENEKLETITKEIGYEFCVFITKLINSFSIDLRMNLLPSELRKNLFYLFASYAGNNTNVIFNNRNQLHSINFQFLTNSHQSLNNSEKFNRKQHTLKQDEDDEKDLKFLAIQAMCSVFCCGPAFTDQCLQEESIFFVWLYMLLDSNEERLQKLGQEAIILLLEFNPDVGSLLDWIVDCCFTKNAQVADICFKAITTIFSQREYPCDHYISIINVTLLNVGCPRSDIHQLALQLLQQLDYRFFDSRSKSIFNTKEQEIYKDDFKPILENCFPATQLELSKKMAIQHPEITMPMFSEITHRFQTAKPCVSQTLLNYLVPWLFNICLNGTENQEEGSVEATEMVLNNLFYITVKFGNLYPKEIKECWIALLSNNYWENNIKIIIRYLFIITSLSPNQLLPFSKRVAIFMMHAKRERLIEELMLEMQTVESLNCTIERTETPPFYRITHRKSFSTHSTTTVNNNDFASLNTTIVMNFEQGTLHTKRHSTESGCDRSKNLDDHFFYTSTTDIINETIIENGNKNDGKLNNNNNTRPLPMPEYGGFYAPLTEYLPEPSQPIQGFYRCNLALMLLTDIVLNIDQVDWSPHLPLMIHIIFLGLDHPRSLVHEHCKTLFVNILLILNKHKNLSNIFKIILNNQTQRQNLPLIEPNLIDANLDLQNYFFKKNDSDDNETFLIYLIHFLTYKNKQLWTCEDITAKVWSIRSADQLENFLENILKVFPNITERWSQIALQLALSCSSRHYAGRSLQIFRSIKVPINSKILSDILSRLVETVSEQGEDMQGYVSELMLTLEACCPKSLQDCDFISDGDKKNEEKQKQDLFSQLFMISIAMLESEYEHEFLLASRLLDKVLPCLNNQEIVKKIEKTLSQASWSNNFKGVHHLLLKGITTLTNTYEQTINLLYKLIKYLEMPLIDSTGIAFPLNVMTLLPYLLLNYNEPNTLCIKAAEKISKKCIEKNLDNLATVMTLYSRRSFSKESFQWTKCVVKYLFDAYPDVFLQIINFLIEMIEKVSSNFTFHIMPILHCILNYVDITNLPPSTINNDLNKIIIKFVQENSPQWEECLKILKLIVTRSSTLAAPPNYSSLTSTLNSFPSLNSFNLIESSESSHLKRELPGRTLEFSFDVNQTPLVGRKYLLFENDTKNKLVNSADSNNSNTTSISTLENAKRLINNDEDKKLKNEDEKKKSFDEERKRSSREREKLVCLLTSFGQKVELPKSPSVIFSLNSDIIMDRQSSLEASSSTEEVSATNEQVITEDNLDQFGLFKEFDFLEYELFKDEEQEPMDNFNWGVRRRSLSNIKSLDQVDQEDAYSENRSSSLYVSRNNDLSSDEESVSPLFNYNNELNLQELSLRSTASSTSSLSSICSSTIIKEN